MLFYVDDNHVYVLSLREGVVTSLTNYPHGGAVGLPLQYSKVSCLETFLFSRNSVSYRARNRSEMFRCFRETLRLIKRKSPKTTSSLLNDVQANGRDTSGCFTYRRRRNYNMADELNESRLSPFSDLKMASHEVLR